MAKPEPHQFKCDKCGKTLNRKFLKARSGGRNICSVCILEPPKEIRQFETGGTRDTNDGKFDYESFNHPLVDKRYAAYMHKHRTLLDGTLRGGDNWQKMFGEKHTDVCIKSLCRHVVDARLIHRGCRGEQTLEDDLCAIIFNAKAYLLKLVLDREKEDNGFSDHDVTICEKCRENVVKPGRTKPVILPDSREKMCPACIKNVEAAKDGEFVRMCSKCRDLTTPGGY
jgi:hypothetical protein